MQIKFRDAATREPEDVEARRSGGWRDERSVNIKPKFHLPVMAMEERPPKSDNIRILTPAVTVRNLPKAAIFGFREITREEGLNTKERKR